MCICTSITSNQKFSLAGYSLSWYKWIHYVRRLKHVAGSHSSNSAEVCLHLLNCANWDLGGCLDILDNMLQFCCCSFVFHLFQMLID